MGKGRRGKKSQQRANRNKKKSRKLVDTAPSVEISNASEFSEDEDNNPVRSYTSDRNCNYRTLGARSVGVSSEPRGRGRSGSELALRSHIRSIIMSVIIRIIDMIGAEAQLGPFPCVVQHDPPQPGCINFTILRANGNNTGRLDRRMQTMHATHSSTCSVGELYLSKERYHSADKITYGFMCGVCLSEYHIDNF